jgi:hypothetical protein
MDSNFIIIGFFQFVVMLIYRWVNIVFISQPRGYHPAIFHSPKARLVLCYGPYIVFCLLVALAFFLTKSPWLFLGLTAACLVAFSETPDPEHLR